MRHALVTGANRGLGFEFARQLLERGDRVFACCRNPGDAAALNQLKSKYADGMQIQRLDVSDEQTFAACLDAIREKTKSLDLLINNAGVYSSHGSESPRETLGNLTQQEAIDVMRVNAIGPILVIQQFLELLRKSNGAKVVNITSGYGSVSQNNGFPYYYSASKAALNQYTRSLATDLRKSKIIAVVMNPGWVATDMGGRQAPVSPADSIRSMLQVIDGLTMKDHGQFLDRFGEKEPW